MEDLGFYFDLGLKHIISMDALDHQLFLLALCAIYLLKNWKQVLILVTAFTIGHSLTLALSVYDVIRVNSRWVEFLIPMTILITASLNLLQKEYSPKSLRINYLLALAFGLIHGLGFANTIRFMLAKNQSIAKPLFTFNIGLEVGQILIVSAILVLSELFVNKVSLPRKWWVWASSGVAIIISADICVMRWPF